MRFLGLLLLLVVLGCGVAPVKQDKLLGDWIHIEGRGHLVFRADGTGEIFHKQSKPETFYYCRRSVSDWERQWASEHGSKLGPLGVQWLSGGAKEVVLVGDKPTGIPSDNHLFYSEKDQTLHNFMDGYVRQKP